MSVLSSVEPKKVFEFFEEISAIPRGSGHTEAISEYCVEFARSRGLECICDSLGDVIIFKNGTKGRENEEPVIFQGHLDMVWEKAPDSDFDFLNSGLKLLTDGEYISAEGTTLGGDDGIAVAISLAILDSDDISHPPIEAVFTIDEETGMDGAKFIDVSPLKGRRMINLDSEAENVLWVSCAGGGRVDITAEGVRINNQFPSYRLLITGLHGGHSGAEIHKGYANASILLGRVLKKLSEYEIYISSLTGGKMDNAITRESECIFSTASDVSPVIKSLCNEIKEEYKSVDPCIEFVLEKAEADTCFDRESTQNIISLLSSFPYGVMKMSEEIEGLVQTSLNLGTMDTNGNEIKFGFSVRSSVNTEREELTDRLKGIAEKHKACFDAYGEYPAWEYKKESPLRDAVARSYKELYGKEMDITAIHAGLECGLFSDKIKGLDCVSIGPDMQDIHTPDERLSIASSKRVYELLIRVLEVI